ncbi:hypothetical protein [Martelella sp. HB161492]|uniref:hypothetical protein n=1 Tax=Martelella sp. HB161492 TaxID=2720726 RepID=UPI00159176B5|nr:hypothetical protein [Martelella sp. HB161492]
MMFSSLQNNRSHFRSADDLRTSQPPIETVRLARAHQTFRACELRSNWVDARLPKLKQAEATTYKDQVTPLNDTRSDLIKLSEAYNESCKSLCEIVLELNGTIHSVANLLPRDIGHEYSRFGAPALPSFTSVDTALNELGKSQTVLPLHPKTYEAHTDAFDLQARQREMRRDDATALENLAIDDGLKAHSREIYRTYDSLVQNHIDLMSLIQGSVDKLNECIDKAEQNMMGEMDHSA